MKGWLSTRQKARYFLKYKCWLRFRLRVIDPVRWRIGIFFKRRIVRILNWRKPYCYKCHYVQAGWVKCKPWLMPINDRITRKHCYLIGLHPDRYPREIQGKPYIFFDPR